MPKEKIQTLTLYRSDFIVMTDGSSIFDHVLDFLLVPDELKAKISTIEIAVRNDYFKAWNDKGSMLFSIPSN